MNKNLRNGVIGVIALIIVVGGIVWYSGKAPEAPAGVLNPLDQVHGTTTAALPVSETTKVSGSLSKYQNAELGFAVQYPNTWEKEETTTGVQFIVPIDKSQVSTVAKLQSDVMVSGGKCAFPPVTTVNERKTVTIGAQTFNMISMSNNVQGRSYFNRMYSLQKDSICYMFAFSYISLSPESKNLSGSNLIQAQNNNKAILNTADEEFTAMVKTFAFVAPPKGQDETQASPTK
ncbi:MAG: hypothetical protein JWO00_93 [Candidatus Parcubacteria bacterium]|nr:hypothetical protein [Candidatus Parcubacteria bacterium]